MSAVRQLSHGTLAKLGFLLGLVLILVGASGEWVIHAALAQAPAWEDSLFLDVEVIGVLVFLLSPFVFGILLPLIE